LSGASELLAEEGKVGLSSLKRHLRAGEKVLWGGKPEKLPFIVPSLVSIPFGLLFMGFSVFWMTMASQAPGPFWFFGIPFFFVGFLSSFGASIRQLISYGNTEYLITDQRIITQTGAIGLDTRFVDLDKIQEVYVNIGFIDRMFGTGTVYATTASYVHVGSGMSMRPSLGSLKEPYEVQKLLQEAVRKTVPPSLSQPIQRCPKCGALVQDYADFCPTCGAEIRTIGR
jgi:membrane protein YdbS with pleckstrin-like domain